ncbi:MAG: hypothetical protein M1819_003504 [Sarea resinae]|nr:MAG: hypothetical protein M1819_003504 [Sarea resinae]
MFGIPALVSERRTLIKRPLFLDNGETQTKNYPSSSLAKVENSQLSEAEMFMWRKFQGMILKRVRRTAWDKATNLTTVDHER